MAIALRFPLEQLKGRKTSGIGLNVITYRRVAGVSSNRCAELIEAFEKWRSR